MNPAYWDGPGFGFMWVFPLLFFIVFLFFMRGMFGRNNNTPAESAREILDKRFARGEISKDEYDEMKKALEHDNK